MNQSLTGILQRFEALMGPFLGVIQAFCYVIAVWMLFKTIRIWERAGQQYKRDQGDSVEAGLWTFLIGVLLLALPTTMSTLSGLFLGSGESPLAYMQPQGSGTLRTLLMSFSLVVGILFVVQGMLVFRKIAHHGAQGDATPARAWVLIGSGVAAANLMFVMRVMNNTLIQSQSLRTWLGG